LRNRERSKADKETDKEIFARHSQNQGFKPLANKLIMFENDDFFEVKKKELLKLIWVEIIQHSK
jgi:hypothetical protein